MDLSSVNSEHARQPPRRWPLPARRRHGAETGRGRWPPGRGRVPWGARGVRKNAGQGAPETGTASRSSRRVAGGWTGTRTRLASARGRAGGHGRGGKARGRAVEFLATAPTDPAAGAGVASLGGTAPPRETRPPCLPRHCFQFQAGHSDGQAPTRPYGYTSLPGLAWPGPDASWIHPASSRSAKRRTARL